MSQQNGAILVSPRSSATTGLDQLPLPLNGLRRLPQGWPSTIKAPLAWNGSQFASAAAYTDFLGEEDIRELEEALGYFKTLGLDGTAVCRANFPLPVLGVKLERIRKDVHQGKGFGLIRGLQPNRYTVEDLTVIHLGVQSYIASRCGRQDKKGNMMVHIIADNSTAMRADHHRHSTASIPFHNEEAGDLISWMTRSSAAIGGNCVIASAYTIYNQLAATRPDLVRALAKSDWPFALPRFHCRPVIYWSDGKLILNVDRTSLLGTPRYPRSDELPSITSQQREALDMIEAIGKANQLEIATVAGDIHIINNLAVLHRRNSFVNGQDAVGVRHLVRMRLRDDELGWSIPTELEPEWDRAFGDRRQRMWHLQPMPDGFFPLRTQPN